VGPDRIEGCDIAGHAGHEAGKKCGESEAEKAGWEIVEQHVGDGEIVVEDGLAILIEHRLTGGFVDLCWDEAVALRGSALLYFHQLLMSSVNRNGDCRRFGREQRRDGDESRENDQ